MSAQQFRQEPHTSRRPAAAPPAATPESQTNAAALWHLGALFHVTTRYPRKRDAVRVDRLAGILRNGLVAPGCCQDGSVCSDLNLVVTGTDAPYDRLIFLHRFGPQSWIYTLHEPGRFTVFVDPALPVLTPEAMGTNWVILSQDEVYVRERIAPEYITAIAVYPADAASVRSELIADFQRVGIPLYDYEGHVHWRPDRLPAGDSLSIAK